MNLQIGSLRAYEQGLVRVMLPDVVMRRRVHLSNNTTREKPQIEQLCAHYQSIVRPPPGWRTRTVMNVSTPEQKDLLLRAAFTQGEGAVTAWHAWNAEIDWHDHVEADVYRLLPQVYHNLSALNADEPRLAKFRGIARKAWYNDHLLFHQLAPVVQSLRAANIPTLLTHGAPMAICYYTDYVLGIGAEFGIAVHPSDVREAIRHLQQFGLEAVPPIQERTLDGICWRGTCTFFGESWEQRMMLIWRLFPEGSETRRNFGMRLDLPRWKAFRLTC